MSRSSQASLAGLPWNLVLHQLPTPLQVSGEKHVTLFDPHHNENLYEAHIPEAILSYSPRTGHFSRQRLLESTSMVMSPVDIQDPDLVRFPRFSRAHRLECDLGPGDVLFMPAFWWHEVRSRPDLRETRNLAVNFWWVDTTANTATTLNQLTECKVRRPCANVSMGTVW